jgi:hypothetical protein
MVDRSLLKKTVNKFRSCLLGELRSPTCLSDDVDMDDCFIAGHRLKQLIEYPGEDTHPMDCIISEMNRSYLGILNRKVNLISSLG